MKKKKKKEDHTLHQHKPALELPVQGSSREDWWGLLLCIEASRCSGASNRSPRLCQQPAGPSRGSQKRKPQTWEVKPRITPVSEVFFFQPEKSKNNSKQQDGVRGRRLASCSCRWSKLMDAERGEIGRVAEDDFFPLSVLIFYPWRPRIALYFLFIENHINLAQKTKEQEGISVDILLFSVLFSVLYGCIKLTFSSFPIT